MISQIQKQLIDKQISAEELTNKYLLRIKQYNPQLNAFITVSEKEALLKAKYIDNLIAQNKNTDVLKNYPLLGIPIAYKDIFSTKSIRTTAASNILKNYTPPYNASVVNKLDKAGAIPIGKTNCDAFAHGATGENSDFGPTKNPYNITHVAGGSSSGSAIAVSSDMCIAATATDTGGSIRTPASHTNTVGIKPTYGRVSRYGIIAMASSTDSIGHITQTVEDSARILSVTAGFDPLDATSSDSSVPHYHTYIGKSIKGLKIGVPKEFMPDFLDGEVRTNIENALSIFERHGARIKQVSLPHTKYGIAVYYIIQPSEVSSNLARFDGIRFGENREDFGPEAKRRIMLGTFALSAGYHDAYYVKAQKIRTLIYRDFESVFKNVDILCAPIAPSTAPKIGETTNDPLQMYLLDIFSVTPNLAGIPSLAVPAGFANNGLPIGIQLMGRHFDEQTLYKAGSVLETELELYKRKPTI